MARTLLSLRVVPVDLNRPGVEKISRAGEQGSRVSGGLLIALGVWILARL
jgi:hypothetical protein